MCTRPSVEVASRGSQLPRISYRIRAALLLYASPVFDNKRIICRACDAIARLNAACALLRSHRLFLLIRLRAPLPPPPTHSFSPFFSTSRVAPASMTFSFLAALAEYFYCEHCLLSASFLCEKKS